MHIENGKLVMGIRKCIACNGTMKIAGKVTCNVCNGTGNGKRGGKNKCRACICGLGYNYSMNNPVPCYRCKDGTIQETITDSVPNEIFRSLPITFKVQDREISWVENNLGVGVYSCVDYGVTFRNFAENPDNTSKILTDEVYNQTGVQACKIARDDGTLAKQIVVIINRGGYSVVAEF